MNFANCFVVKNEIVPEIIIVVIIKINICGERIFVICEIANAEPVRVFEIV